MEREVRNVPKAERLEDLPPKIQELLKKRGWTWPPTEEMRREWREAWEQIACFPPTDPEVLEMVWEEDRPNWWVRLKSDPEAYRRWKEEATKRYQQWKAQQEQKKGEGDAC